MARIKLFFGNKASAGGGATYTLTADSGSIAVTGTAASLKFNRVLAAGAGATAITGTDAALKFNRVLSAAAGSISITGTDAALKLNRVLAAASGAFAITGTDATLTYTPIGGPTYTLTADAGAIVISGIDASLKFNRAISCSAGSISITGSDATLTVSSLHGFTQDQLDFLVTYMEANMAVPTTAQIAAAVVAEVVEGTYTLKDMLRLIAAVSQGSATGLESGAPVFKSIDGTKDRVTATYATGTRTVTARDAT